MVGISAPLVERGIVVLALLVATVADLRRREVPLWLSLGLITSGVTIGALHGPNGMAASLIGLAAGTLPIAPFVVLGGFGGADLLLLGAVGTLEGWHVALLAEFWTALVGGALALVARRRHESAFPYVPAILLGTAFAFLMT